jgi:hypothetical protein
MVGCAFSRSHREWEKVPGRADEGWAPQLMALAFLSQRYHCGMIA